MPTKRNRRDSESSNCSINGIIEDQNGASEPLSPISSGVSSTSMELEGAGVEMTWLRSCCTPLGCLLTGQVNLSEPDEIEKIVCSNENCTASPYMHKECFNRWEDGLLTYLRSHGRARSWSEKQRRQNLWTKRGYDLAYRACACSCGRGHLRKDLIWDPKDVTLPSNTMKKVAADESAKKKNRKKHKDLPTLGNKYTFGTNRTKSKAIPANGKDNRVRTNSTSSVISNDQGYSSSSPSNSEIHGPFGNGLFSPPPNGRNPLQANVARFALGHRSQNSPSFGNPLFPHAALPQIPDSDVLEDFCGNMAQLSAFCEVQSLKSCEKMDLVMAEAYRMEQKDVLSPLHNVKPFVTHHMQQTQQQLLELGKVTNSMDLLQRQRCNSWDKVPQSPLAHNDPSPPEKPVIFDFMTRQLNMPHLSAGTDGVNKPTLEMRNGPGLLKPAAENDAMSCSLPLFGHWNQPPLASEQPCRHSQAANKRDTDLFCQCYPSNKVSEQPPLLPFQAFMDNATTMLYSDIDLKKPKVIVIPGESPNNYQKRTCTEISITPMCSTVFHKRHDFMAFESILNPNQVNPYHIKMEGEGYGSDDFRNSVLSKLSRAKVSEMNCVTCGKGLLIYDHFPLLDGSLFLSPIKNERAPNDLKIDIENKSEYLHAVCVGCMEGANNLMCLMCEGRWRGPFHQLGSLYLYDVFAAAPCCQSRLCCKRCGVAIIDRRLGLKYFSQYSSKTTCPSCGTADYHFVHPASTFRVLGPDKFHFF